MKSIALCAMIAGSLLFASKCNAETREECLASAEQATGVMQRLELRNQCYRLPQGPEPELTPVQEMIRDGSLPSLGSGVNCKLTATASVNDSGEFVAESNVTCN